MNDRYRIKIRIAALLNRNTVGVALLIMMISAGSVVFGSDEIKNQDKADVLQRLQLFQGTDKGYDLDKAFTRAQGAVMLIRLIGQEDEAMKANGSLTFTDVKQTHWAAASISYAHSKWLVSGITVTKFAPERTMNGAQFIALILRALGYNNADPRQALELARTSGLLGAEDAERLISKKVFLRDDMILVAYSSLTTTMRNSDITLIQKLVEDEHAVNKEMALASGLYTESANLINSQDPMDRIEHAIRKALNPEHLEGMSEK